MTFEEASLEKPLSGIQGGGVVCVLYVRVLPPFFLLAWEAEASIGTIIMDAV